MTTQAETTGAAEAPAVEMPSAARVKRIEQLLVADPAVKLVVFCHVGQRSAQVTFWLQDLGWQKVASLAGGIDAYARQVDPEIGFY